MDAIIFQTEALRLERLMYSVSFSLLGSDADCADAVQEALARAWPKRRSLRDAAQFRPWLMRILVNQCNDMLRRRKRRSLLPLPDTLPEEPPSFDPMPVREAVARLKPALRLVVTLHYLEGWSVEETAAMTGVPVNTVKSRLRAARKQLAILLREEWEEEP